MDNSTVLLSIESFPPLNESIQKMNEICQAEEIDLKAFTGVIEADPLLYTSILRYTNVSHHGFKYPITSISQAIALFGISAIRGMSLTAALKAHPFSDVSAYGVSVNEWFDAMERQQRFLDLWLGKKHRHFLQSLGGLTFILEIGRLVVSFVMMSTNKEHCFSSLQPCVLISEEAEVIGYSGDELSSQLFQHWNFDPLFVNAMHYMMEPKEGSEPKICAALQCARTLFMLNGMNPFETVKTLLEEYGFEMEDAKIAYDIVVSQP